MLARQDFNSGELRFSETDHFISVYINSNESVFYCMCLLKLHVIIHGVIFKGGCVRGLPVKIISDVWA